MYTKYKLSTDLQKETCKNSISIRNILFLQRNLLLEMKNPKYNAHQLT